MSSTVRTAPQVRISCLIKSVGVYKRVGARGRSFLDHEMCGIKGVILLCHAGIVVVDMYMSFSYVGEIVMMVRSVVH